MTDNNFNIGSDAKLTILVDGAPLAATILTSFSAKQETAKVTSNAADGIVRNRDVEQGWSGTAEYDRANGLVDDFFATKEASRYAGFPPPVMNIMQTVRNTDDGSVSRYRFDGVTATLENSGTYEGDKKVTQQISWRASRRIKVS